MLAVLKTMMEQTERYCLVALMRSCQSGEFI